MTRDGYVHQEHRKNEETAAPENGHAMPTGTGLDAPFPWFGGKRRVADEVWSALGPVDTYVEPFAGSLAVLLGRPDERWQTGLEVVNDADAYICNFWRALSAAPDEVAYWADYPCNETDLFARHMWLVRTREERIGRLEADPDYYDAKVAGWWVWGLCSWIGSGWCSGAGPWSVVDGKVVCQNGSGGVFRHLPRVWQGVGVHRKLPHLAGIARGVHRSSITDLRAWFLALAARLRRVRVCCGDWSRVVTRGALAHGTVVGVFLDPPYLGEVRDKCLYRVDDNEIAHAVRDWAVANGDDPRMRIMLAGYEDEHADHMPANWRMYAWSARSSYQTSTSSGGNKENRHKERLWMSPHCLDPEPMLFG